MVLGCITSCGGCLGGDPDHEDLDAPHRRQSRIFSKRVTTRRSSDELDDEFHHESTTSADSEDSPSKQQQHTGMRGLWRALGLCGLFWSRNKQFSHRDTSPALRALSMHDARRMIRRCSCPQTDQMDARNSLADHPREFLIFGGPSDRDYEPSLRDTSSCPAIQTHVQHRMPVFFTPLSASSTQSTKALMSDTRAAIEAAQPHSV